MKTSSACLLLLMPIGIAAAEGPRPAREAVDRALPWLEKEGTWWIEAKDCVSCHHTSFFVWAKDLAADAGYQVDTTTLNQQRDWMIASLLSPVEADPEAKEEADASPGEINADRNMEGVAQFLLSPSVKFAQVDDLEKLRQSVASARKADGNWEPGGQLPRQQRPKAETMRISNQWADLALRGSTAAPEDQVVTWEAGNPSKTTEWYVMNLIGYPNEKSVDQLLRRQNEDGGWSWLQGEESSPTATGQALFALSRCGIVPDHAEVVDRARAYLIESQDEDGHWEEFSTKNREESTRVSDFWGSAWAVIGLLESEAAAGGTPGAVPIP